jgi:hypothetical protein
MKLLALLLLSACKVYLPPCEPGTEDERAHPGGGVTVNRGELDDADGGAE